jgi:hypothetical protein
MSLDTNIFKNFLINEMFEYNNEGKRLNRAEGENKFNLLSQILKDCNAVIAGGSVLSAYVDSRSSLNDIDIYVNKKNAIELKNRIKEIGYTNIYKVDVQSQYDNSFFVKNNIIARFPIGKTGSSYLDESPYMDIIIVADNVDVIQVVNNFDLTFCEIWYDGIHVHAADPKGVLEKKGYLKKDYVEKLLVCFNKFTIKRIDKYKYKRFEIKYDPKVNLSEIILNNDKDCDGNVVTSPEKWVASIIFKTINSFLFLPDIFKYIDINSLRNISSFGSTEEFMELLPIYNLSRYNRYEEPRYDEAKFFFRNILFDIFCKCTSAIDIYSMDSVKNLLDCLGVKPNNRKEFVTGLISHMELYSDEYLQYILDIVNISRKNINDYIRKNNIKKSEYLSEGEEDTETDEDMEADEEEMESDEELVEDKNNRKRKRGYSESEEELDDSNEDDYRRTMSRKRKLDDYEEEVDDFLTTDISNITSRLSNIRAREDDNIITKKRRVGDDSGDDNDSITLINKSNNNQFHTVTFNRSYLDTIIRNKKNLFFECTSTNKIVTPIVIYAKIPLNHRKTFYCFIPIDSIKKIFADNRKVYYLYPVLENEKQKIIQNSGSLNNINTCRNNGNILVYRIKSSSRVYFEGAEISERF